MRLDKLLTALGVASRSGCRQVLKSGRVRINGKTVADAGAGVSPEDQVYLDGQLLDVRLERHVMLYKPGGILTAAEDKKQQTVMDLLPEVYRSLRCMPVGRLDKDTTGLLLLTTDGEMAHRLIAPQRHVDKVYRATVDGALDESGAIAVEGNWLYMDSFSNGLAKVAGQEGMGVIDSGGRVVIGPVFRWLERSAAMIAAWDGENIEIYGPRGGQRRARLPGRALEIALTGDYLSVVYDGRTCLYNAYGRLLRQSQGTVSYAPGTRGQLIASDGSWGEKCQQLVNPDGSKASGMFQQLLPLCAERYAFLEMKGEDYESEVLGTVQTAWDYAGCRYGLMDGRGRILISAKYREIRALSSDRLLLIGDDRTQIADRNGVVMKTWITPETTESSREAAE